MEMPKNPFENFNRILSAEEIIDIAFRKGEKTSASIPKMANKMMKAKRKEVRRVKNVNSYILKQIKQIVQSVPNLDELHPFYQELSDLLVDDDKFRKNLGKLNGLIPVFQKIVSETIRNINSSDDPYACAKYRRQYYARAASILNGQTKTLEYLEDTRKKLSRIPTIDTSLPSLVIAGYPNVGKSSLVGRVSTANPEICEYPFTTKKIIIGVYRDKTDTKLFQLIDTPGVLDRPMDQRNEIERQSILALRTVSNIVIFMFDPTLSSGYPVEKQIALFQEIKENLIEVVNVPWFVILNKQDFATAEENEFIIKEIGLKANQYIQTNAKDGDLDVFVSKVMDIVTKNNLWKMEMKTF